ncbi:MULTISPECIES: hypothetical protein [unclassified Okeania]|uniref:hypothetical protein n=1 Tax=unclassified Okeania TaxID=2634635 RepID=UPI0013BB3887|nr:MULTISPECIES: hypothetical protein [unclassified Okeania]NET14280.1 hypothetical protein [Okeania sp. SIO1H6]NES74871.1 hypothetical protein [Okeania sp. SIO1H4]NES88720.1 hypothetical protein [Okeania sp. SIO2B9]NET20805.1 hypothetical protein [Okeania sp. SIO1H5]NET91950.1 hypothetical protein [Okeania sp. SIO1H2]
MSYSKFTIEELQKTFNLTIVETVGKFNDLPEIPPSQFLQEALQYYLPLAVAIGTEKARSELIIAPILFAIKKQLDNQISIFSGVEFNIDTEQGLNGFCDFIISCSSLQLLIEAPVVALVEAKNDNIKSGLAQCMAEMVAAQVFNQREDNEIPLIYGVVTTGTTWQFLELESQTMTVDLEEYSVKNLPKILGILTNFVSYSTVS